MDRLNWSRSTLKMPLLRTRHTRTFLAQFSTIPFKIRPKWIGAALLWTYLIDLTAIFIENTGPSFIGLQHLSQGNSIPFPIGVLLQKTPQWNPHILRHLGQLLHRSPNVATFAHTAPAATGLASLGIENKGIFSRIGFGHMGSMTFSIVDPNNLNLL